MHEIPTYRGRVTDKSKVEELRLKAPASFKSAQDCLVAADKYLHKKGFLTTDKIRLERLLQAIFDLKDNLRREGVIPPETATKETIEFVIGYMSQVSEAVPNWQAEYNLLSTFIPEVLR